MRISLSSKGDAHETFLAHAAVNSVGNFIDCNLPAPRLKSIAPSALQTDAIGRKSNMGKMIQSNIRVHSFVAPGPLYLAAVVLAHLACMTLFVWLSL